MKKIIRRKLPDNNPLSDQHHPLLKRIYLARGVKSDQELNYDLKNLLPFYTLKNIGLAAQRIAQAITKQEKILIAGDYDADGATSTALAVRTLCAFGAKNVDFLVPDRFQFGYGLSPAIVEVAKTKNPHNTKAMRKE